MKTTTDTKSKKDIIIEIVEQYYGVGMQDMCVRNTQKYPDAAARNMLCYLLREEGDLKYNEIADIFGVSLRNVFFRIRKTKTDLGFRGRLYQDYQEINNILKTNKL